MGFTGVGIGAIKSPATLIRPVATGLTEEEAHNFKDILTDRYIEEK